MLFNIYLYVKPPKFLTTPPCLGCSYYGYSELPLFILLLILICRLFVVKPIRFFVELCNLGFAMQTNNSNIATNHWNSRPIVFLSTPGAFVNWELKPIGAIETLYYREMVHNPKHPSGIIIGPGTLKFKAMTLAGQHDTDKPILDEFDQFGFKND